MELGAPLGSKLGEELGAPLGLRLGIKLGTSLGTELGFNDIIISSKSCSRRLPCDTIFVLKEKS